MRHKFIETTFLVNVTQDTNGQVNAYILHQAADGQWAWLADQEFGPFDTRGDVLMWLCRRMLAKEPSLLS